MFELPLAVRQRVIRTHQEAQARLDYAQTLSAGLRKEIALLPEKEQRSAGIREILLALDGPMLRTPRRSRRSPRRDPSESPAFTMAHLTVDIDGRQYECLRGTCVAMQPAARKS